MKHRSEGSLIGALLGLFVVASSQAGTIGRFYNGEKIWAPLGAGFDDDVVNALAWSDGTLYAGGYFSEAGGVAVNQIAQWDGEAWSPLGTGVDTVGGYVMAMLAVDGKLYVGGEFDSIGGVPANNIAAWDGASWTNLGAGVSSEGFPCVFALAHDGTNLYAGGDFSTAGETNANFIARWDGETWHPLGNGMDDEVYALSIVGTNLFAGGVFYTVGETNAAYIAQWNGTDWAPVGGDFDGSVWALRTSGDKLYAGGWFTVVDGMPMTNAAVWSTTSGSWTNLASGIDTAAGDGSVYALALADGQLHAGGLFDQAGGVSASHVAAWDGGAWTNLGAGIEADGWVNALASDGDTLFVGGSFADAGGTAANNIAMWGPEILEDYGVAPREGSWVGGFEVVITGSDLGDGSDVTNVTLSGISASILSQSSTQIVVLAGAAPGTLLGDVRMYSTSQGETFKTNAFAYKIPGFELRNASGSLMASGASASTVNGTAFGNCYLGQSMTNRFTVKNTGAIDLTLGDVVMTGTGTDNFAVVDLAATIPPGETDEFTVVFSPLTRGRFLLEARLANDSPTDPFVIKLSGRGIAYAPEIDPPASQSADEGDTVTLEPNVVGSTPFHFQWLKNGTAIPGADGNALVLANVSPSDSGLYQLVATNAAGMALSRPARVAVAPTTSLVWGGNALGQLGIGTSGDNATNALDTGIAAVFAAAGAAHSIFLGADGTRRAAGGNAFGQLGDGTTTPRLTSVLLATPDNLVGVAAGQGHTLLLDDDGYLYTTGDNASGQLGTGGTTPRTSPAGVYNGYDVVAVAAGDAHSLFIKDTGALYAMGLNADGQLGDGTTSTSLYATLVAQRAIAIAAGGAHSLFVKDDGSLWAMGDNAHGQLGDGTLQDRKNEVVIAQNVAGVAAGHGHSLIVKRDGTLWGMGLNEDGQLGLGDTAPRNAPALISSNVVHAAAGKFHSLFQTADGSVWAMGRNISGELGGDWQSPQLHPVRIPCLSLAAAVTGASASHTLAVGTRLPPEIVVDPDSQSIVYGEGAEFAVAAVGFAPLFHQWRLDGVPLVGETATNLVIASATFADAGVYDVVVSNALGAVVSAAATLEVRQIIPTVSVWPTASGIVHGQTLAASTLDGGSGSVPGSFAFAEPATVPQAGTQPHSVVFTPTDAVIYATVTGAVDVAVAKATPEIAAWPSATPLTYGQTLLHSTLEGGWASVVGTFAFTEPSTAPDVGAAFHPVAFSPVDSANYNSVTGAISVTVGKAASTISAWPSASAIYRGEPLSKSILSGGSASVAGSFAFLSPTDTPPVGTASHAVRFTPEDTTHYLAADGMVAVVVVSALEIEEVPEPVEASAGTSFTLDASATGAEPRHFQWYRNGEPISGATNATLAFSDATLADTGLYQVLVTNALSLRLSAPTRVAVDSPKLIGWGGNDDGQLGDGSTDDRTAPVFIAPDAVTAVAGAAHSLFVTADGSLRTMGANASGQLGDGTTAPRSTPVAVLGGTNVVAVAAGAAHSLFVAEDGILRAMGANAGGQLGDGTTTPRSTPVAVPGGTNVVAVAAGAAHSLFVTADGALWAMGDNASGQLGDGTTTPRSTPVAVLGGSNVVAVAAGAAHSLFLTSNGAIWAMGGNDQGQLGDGSTTPRPTPVCIAQGIRSFAAGGTHSLLLDADGTLRATGANADGQLGDGTATPRPAPVTVIGGTNVAAFAAGAAHSLLLDFDGTLLATGANDQGQLGDGSTTPRLTPEPAEPVLIAGLASGPAASHVLAIGALVYDFVYVPLGDGTVVITGYVGEGGDIAIPEQLNGMAVAAIADEAFLGASGLVSVHIPATVTNIGASAFAYCPLLMTFTVDSANSAYQSLDGVLFSLDGTVLAQYPVGRGGVYTLPEGVATIAAGAFAGADGLTSVIVPTSTTAIGDGAFASCANLAAVYFRGDAPTTGEDVFGKVLGIVYYPPTASGWGATFGGLDAFAWNAAVEAGAGFGMQGGVFGFNVVGSSGMVVIVEAADDLTSPAWTPVSTQTLSNGSAPFEDPGSVDKPSRFYRLRMP